MTDVLPATTLPGAIPTLNGKGFMLEALDAYAEAFVRDAAAGEGECLDIGCAYGVATLAALAAGARVCACDMEPQHLLLLQQRTPEAQRGRLRTVVGLLPGVAFPAASFHAILASRVIHFLSGADLRLALAAMYDWLKPGGRLYLVADTSYMPGFIADFGAVVSGRPGNLPGPEFLNTLDPDILARECLRAGLQVERASVLRHAAARGGVGWPRTCGMRRARASVTRARARISADSAR